MTRFAVLLALAAGAAALAGCADRGAAPANGPGAPAPAAAVTETIKVSGMTCGGCENSIKSSVAKLEGVREVQADHAAGRATVTYDPAKVDRAAIKGAIEKLGYKVEG